MARKGCFFNHGFFDFLGVGSRFLVKMTPKTRFLGLGNPHIFKRILVRVGLILPVDSKKGNFRSIRGRLREIWAKTFFSSQFGELQNFHYSDRIELDELMKMQPIRARLDAWKGRYGHLKMEDFSNLGKICFGDFSVSRRLIDLGLAAFDREKIKEETFFLVLGPFSTLS